MRKGFTLIELLVVIAIIGILSAVVLASLTTTRSKARDAARKNDLHSIQTALEMYYSICGTYVVKLNCAGSAYGSGGIGWYNYNYGTGSVGKGLADNGLTAKEIIEPSGAITGANAYMLTANATRYTIWATIENPTADDIATLSKCYFTNYNYYGGAGTHNYCVSN